jgi:hypothetical protein
MMELIGGSQYFDLKYALKTHVSDISQKPRSYIRLSSASTKVTYL